MNPMVPTKEELEMIRDSIILPFMLDMIENERNKLERDTQPLRGLFLAANEKLMNTIHSELVRVKKELRERKIKVVEDGRELGELRYRYWCRGYEDTFMMVKYVVKSELSVRFGKAIAEVSRELGKK